MLKYTTILLSLVLVGCGSASVKTNNKKAFENFKSEPIDKIVIIPVKITIKEAGVGSLEKLPEKSKIASEVVQQELTNILQTINSIETIQYEATSDVQIEELDEYIGLYQRVAGSAQFVGLGNKAWAHKVGADSDYTLGEKIKFIKEKTGVTKAMFVYGEDIVTSGGAKALAVLAMLGGVGVNPGGIAILHLGIVDLNNGELIWSNTIANQTMSLDKAKSVNKAILETLETSPLKQSE